MRSDESAIRSHARGSTTQQNAVNNHTSSRGEIVPRPADNRPLTPRSGSPAPTTDDIGQVSRCSSSEPDAGEGPKFVGHLNPEGIFLAMTRLGASQASRCDDTLGFWLPGKPGRGAEDEEQQPLNRRSEFRSSKSPSVARALVPPQRVMVLPDPQSFNALRAIYFEDIHPLFPILQPGLIPEITASAGLSPTEVILMQSLCLAMATNAAARPFLRFQGRKGVLTPKLFANRLSQALVEGLRMIGSIDRLISVRVFTILSLFSQLSTDDHTSAEYCARAVSYTHTMQLHLDTAHVRTDDPMVTQVFLCVWALDRLNAAFHSRPLLIHARDIGRNMDVSIAQQDGCFRVLLMICGLLEEIITLYRPSHESRASNNDFAFPSFEDLVIRADGVRCETRFLGEFKRSLVTLVPLDPVPQRSLY